MGVQLKQRAQEKWIMLFFLNVLSLQQIADFSVLSLAERGLTFSISVAWCDFTFQKIVF